MLCAGPHVCIVISQMQRRVVERVVEKRVETGVSLDQVKQVAEQHEQTKR